MDILSPYIQFVQPFALFRKCVLSHSSGEKTVISPGNVVRTANGKDFVVLGMKFHYRVEESLSDFIRANENFLELGRCRL